MKKTLVTGADGFIGSHLTELLLKKGYYVKALSYYNSFNNWGWLEQISPDERLQIVTGDIRDPYFIKEIVKDVEIVFHLAALIAIPFSYHTPQSYLETNVAGTLNICQAAKEAGGIRILHTSTSEVYGTAQYIPMDEKHPKKAQSPYSASKIAGDAMAMSYHYSFGLPVTVVRPFNTFGPRQSARAFIPSVISQIVSGMKQIRVGDLTPTRDLNYVIDVCYGFLSIAEADNTIGREINIASNTEISMEKTVEIIRALIKADVEIVQDKERIRPSESEVYRLIGDNSLLKELTGWCPGFSLEEGLRNTIKWFMVPENLAKYKSNIYNI